MPNIVYIMADDMGYADVSCYGRPDFVTPNIDRIAAGGVRLLQAYANSAVCSATRTALITGRYQYRLPIGLEEPLPSDAARNIGIPPDHPTLPSLRQIRRQYGTTLIGKVAPRQVARLRPRKAAMTASTDSAAARWTTSPTNTVRRAATPTISGDGDVKIHQVGYLTDLRLR